MVGGSFSRCFIYPIGYNDYTDKINFMAKQKKNIDELPYKKKSWLYRFIKRSGDIFFSSILIIILSPLLLILTLIVWISTKGNPIFKDMRVGYKHKPIGVLKFRTMYIDAETNIDKYLNKKQKRQWKKERKVNDDPRITPTGKLLRRTSLDELPQLFNIFIGNMTFVGPRPITEHEVTEYFSEEEQKILLSCRPGLIGYWAVMGRSNVSFSSGERQKLELDYFKLRSTLFDISLIFRVIPAVLKGKGAK